MSIVMRLQWDGVTKDQYEQIRKEVQWETKVPKGAQFHVSSFDDRAMYITDIWNSEQEFNDFFEHRVKPAVQRAGLTTMPDVKVTPMHAVFAPGYQK